MWQLGKHKDTPPLADWEVTLSEDRGTVIVPASWWRCPAGGHHYRFYDDQGIVHDFAPWAVLHVRRADRAIHEATGIIVPNALNGGMISECRCGEKFAGVSEQNARELLAWHIAYPRAGTEPVPRPRPPLGTTPRRPGDG